VRVLALSDTHIPRAAHDLPDRVYAEIGNVDIILHAGDFVESEILYRLRGLKKTYAVHGNMDTQELRRVLKYKEIIQVGKFKIGLIHGYGPPRDIIETVKSEFTDVDAIVFGHSHSAVNIVKDGVLFLNPGSPTDTVFASKKTYGIIEITDNDLQGKIVTL
jgi:putative phosphoesterase